MDELIANPFPQSAEAENAVVCSCLIAPDEVIDKAAQVMTPADFFDTACSTVFAQLLEMRNAGTPIDFVTLTQRLRDAQLLDAIGGPAAISGLYTFTPTAANWRHYAGIVKDKSRLRNAWTAARAISEKAMEPGATSDDIETMLQALAMEVARATQTGQQTQEMRPLLLAALERMEARFDGRGVLPGITSGLAQLDKICGGWKPGQMIVIAAEEKHGKSSLARQFALAALKVGRPVGYITLEMSAAEIVDAMVSQWGKVQAKPFSEPITKGDVDRNQKAMSQMMDFPFFVRDEADMSVNQFRAAARTMKLQHGIKLLVVDYLQLMQANGTHDRRDSAVSEISRNVKLCAKELQIPVIVLCQLNEERKTRESRAIQMDLDVMITIEHKGGMPEPTVDASSAWLNVTRQRGGATGRTPCTWLGAITTFAPRAFDPTEDSEPKVARVDPTSKGRTGFYR